jgi:hypothetical protein
VRHFTEFPKEPFSFDLHVLSTPPTFVLSQDQTLQFNILTNHLIQKNSRIGLQQNKNPNHNQKATAGFVSARLNAV